MPNFTEIETFIAVARHGSFTRAADDMNVSRTMASKYVQSLESELGVKLLNRTTRAVHLTEVGTAYLEKVRAALDALRCAGELAAEMSGHTTGILRVALPLSFATLCLDKVLARFQAAFPAIKLELDLSDAVVDLIAGGYDVALRIGPTPDSSLKMRQLQKIPRQLCAAPKYLEKHGRPKTPQDLGNFNCLDYRHMSERTQWVLSDGKDQVSVFVSGDVRANNGEMLTKLAIAGCGIINIPTFIASQALQSGALEQVLPEFTPPSQPLCALYPSGQSLPMKARVFIDFIAGDLKLGISRHVATASAISCER